MKIRKAVIPVAGLGTRMLPATKAIPKEMVPVAGKPAVQWVVEAAVASGVEEIIFVTSTGKAAIEDHFSAAPLLEAALAAAGKHDLLNVVRAPQQLARFASAWQPEPLGLGHAVLMSRDLVGDEPFAVLLPDELLIAPRPALAQCLDLEADAVLGLARVPREEVSRYGIVSVKQQLDERTFVIGGMVEKPSPESAPSDLAITGNPYLLPPRIFDALERLPRPASGEIQLTDGLRALAGEVRMLGRIVEGERHDVGNLAGFVQANVALGLGDPRVGSALRAWLEARLR
jgi:UTP--glucose-1-phosphate uridylyltransferase